MAPSAVRPTTVPFSIGWLTVVYRILTEMTNGLLSSQFGE